MEDTKQLTLMGNETPEQAEAIGLHYEIVSAAQAAASSLLDLGRKLMQKIQTDVTAKANKVSTDAAKVEGYAKAAQYLIGYNKKNILTVFLYEE